MEGKWVTYLKVDSCKKVCDLYIKHFGLATLDITKARIVKSDFYHYGNPHSGPFIEVKSYFCMLDDNFDFHTFWVVKQDGVVLEKDHD